MIRHRRRESGLSMVEVAVALTLLGVIALASVQLVTRAVALIGSSQTVRAERAARVKTRATQWVQAELEYLRSLEFIKLQRIVLDPASQRPPWSGGGGIAYRDITPDRSSLAPGEMPFPPLFERARVAVEVEALEPPGCTADCRIALLRIRVALYRRATDLPPPRRRSGTPSSTPKPVCTSREDAKASRRAERFHAYRAFGCSCHD